MEVPVVADNPAQIVFLGPSLLLERAKEVLPDADFRPPVKRDDLAAVPPGSIVAIIDGVFAQSLAISPGEIRDSIDRGVQVYGAASMGALRAAEIPAVIGVGRIYEMYCSGVIERDDEVAVMLRPDTFASLTEPLVNVRFAVERLVRTGTLSRVDGDAIVQAAAKLHFSDRTYPAILAASSLSRNRDVADIICLLKRFDLKADDALLLLETIAHTEPRPTTTGDARPTNTPAYARVNAHESSSASILIWESGDRIQFEDLVRFLKVAGAFERYAARAISSRAAAGCPLRIPAPLPTRAQSIEAAQKTLDLTRFQWGWDSPEEAHVTMRDLGLGLEDVADTLEAEATVEHLVRAFATAPTEAFNAALRVELWRDALALKRETLRLGALQYFAAEGGLKEPPTAEELIDARRCIARLRHAFRWEAVATSLRTLGLSAPELDASIEQLALARRAGAPVTSALDRPTPTAAPVQRKAAWSDLPLALTSSIKAADSPRFSLSEAETSTVAADLAKQIGIVRIGLVGELDNLGIHIAQAYGQRSGWSSSFSSGKSESREGARVGSIMEEVEIFAQDRYSPAAQIHRSFGNWSAEHAAVDPLELGLPYDSRYTDALEFDWAPCYDLVSAQSTYVPTSSLLGQRQLNDIFYSPRLGGKIFSSSGLGSGFSLAEAIVHAGAEYIERHAYRLAEIQIDNPGSVGDRQFRFVDETTLPETPARIVGKYHHAGVLVRIVDITSDVAVPTYWARIFDDPFNSFQSASADGFACHPDPGVAVTMALLEAAQTRGGYIAGGREDYSLHARSLGRHERPRTAVPQSQAFWFSNDRPLQPFDANSGIHARDILDELEWMVDRVVRAGSPAFLVADYTTPQIRPAHAVRVLIPGLEVTNPLFTGRRARATLIRDLLPHGPRTQ
ncbi:YcaO-like family protein [Mycobacterium decipiens]|nr:YcaO-like family protein [Mycobacterium decipiens]